ncbi:MAG: DUF1425 domain-containing protein [Planctomycetota bacterium]|nr:DUF1425 domain-containing protein [Planctomycetota bacterium]
MKLVSTPLFAALCAAALAAACSSPGVHSGPLSGQAVTVGQDDVSDLIDLDNERVAFGGNDLAVYQVEVVNRTRGALRLEYRARWFDDDGIEVDDATRTWKPIFVSGSSSFPVRSVARNMRAVRCVMEVRSHNPSTY